MFDWRDAALDAENRYMEVKRQNDRLNECIDNLLRAIEEPGRDRFYHKRVLRMHQREWPLLWKRIEELRQEHIS